MSTCSPWWSPKASADRSAAAAFSRAARSFLRDLELIADADERKLEELEPLLTIGLNHEQQHQELMVTDLKHVLTENPLRPVYRERSPVLDNDYQPLQCVKFDECVYLIGHDSEEFAFDNETLGAALKAVAEQAGVQFVYSRDVVPIDRRVTLRAAAKSGASHLTREGHSLVVSFDFGPGNTQSQTLPELEVWCSAGRRPFSRPELMI
jgi:hypothetical protein